MLTIRKTTEADFEKVMEIYAYARKFMAEHGNPKQWGATHWPPEELIHRDIAAGKSYLCVDTGDFKGETIGTVFFFDYGPDIEPTYREITDGAWGSDTPYGVVHRLAGSGLVKGAGKFAINWAYEQCGHLRIDTHTDNVVMQRLMEGLGFARRGIIYVKEDNDPRIAYEKGQ